MNLVWERFQAGVSIAAIARELDINEETVIKHLCYASNAGMPLRTDGLIEASTLAQIDEERVMHCFDELGVERLKPVFEAMEQKVSYSQLHLWRLIYLVQGSDE